MPPASLHLLSLPDDVLCRCFAELSFLEMHQALPLTCRRFSCLVNSPQLLRTVEFDSTVSFASPVERQTAKYLPRAQSFACWAVRHAAGAARRLSLKIGTQFRSPDEPDAIWGDMLGVLAACGAAGGLQEVELSIQYATATVPAWLPVALRSVRLLHLEVEEGMLTVDVPLTAMAALEDLHLRANVGDLGLYFTLAAALPPRLTRLHIAGFSWTDDPPEELPVQIATLPALRHLSLETCAFTQHGLEPLSQLAPSLEALQIDYCKWPPTPATLACLTGVTFLDVDNFIGDREESMDDVPEMLEEMLAALPQLRALRVSFWGSGYYMSVPVFPRSATALQHLQHLMWDMPVLQDDTLPPASWLTGLQSLALPGDMIAHNTAALALAQQLQYLAALLPRDRARLNDAPGHADWHPGAVQWAASHPLLRRLDIEVPHPRLGNPPPGPSFHQANAAAMLQNPALQIRTESGLGGMTLEQFVEHVECLPG